MSKVVMHCHDLCRTFVEGALEVNVLRDLEISIHAGESVAIVGASGSGKSTLLHLLAGLDRPDAGIIEIDGESINQMGDRSLARLRNRHMGFVYQMHHLLPEFTALENVAIPKMIGGASREQAEEAAMVLLERLGLKERATHRPGELSGGERQRVAVCRALVMNPDVVLADEPTGNLDPETAQDVFQLMREVNAEFGVALVLVTHDKGLAFSMQTGYQLLEGKVVKEWGDGVGASFDG